jgi:hypothetical protein
MTAKAKSWSQVAILTKGGITRPQHFDPLPPPPLPYRRCEADSDYLRMTWTKRAPSSRAATVSAEAVPSAWECSFRLP